MVFKRQRREGKERGERFNNKNNLGCVCGLRSSGKSKEEVSIYSIGNLERRDGGSSGACIRLRCTEGGWKSGSAD